jgi:hypothetical protein
MVMKLILGQNWQIPEENDKIVPFQTFQFDLSSENTLVVIKYVI